MRVLDKEIDEIIADGIQVGLSEQNLNPDDIVPFVLQALEIAGYELVPLVDPEELEEPEKKPLLH